jgi:hypothetical protein
MKKTVVVNEHHNRRQCFFCESECLYMEKLTYVQQIEIQKTQWSLTAILMKDKYLCDNKCLYVEKITYSK